MAEPVAIVEQIAAIGDGARPQPRKARGTKRGSPAYAPDGAVPVRFADDSEAWLSLADPRTPIWSDVLRTLQERRRPAYVEVDPRTRVITALLQPKPDRVAELRAPERGGDVEVLLATSHALHLLSRRRPRFTQLLAILRRAHKAGTPLWITETLDSHEILDARPLERGGSPAR
jgi:hypothetical protein